MSSRNKKQTAFTLIELLIVIAIIGLLASIVLAALNISRARARDSRRLGDMRQIITALDIYYDQNQHYPDTTSYFPGSTCNGYDTSNNGSQPFLKPLLTSGILVQAPADPQNTGSCSPNPTGAMYAYKYYAAGSNGCPPSKGNYYVLGVRYMETTLGGTYPGSPGFQCSGNNWQTQFSWVVGKFENQ